MPLPSEELAALRREKAALTALLRWYIRTYRVDDQAWDHSVVVDRILQQELAEALAKETGDATD